jgi:hypothetical protein
VADTGKGISASVLGKIFEPFFTTKEIGKGTGLGLSTVAAIVKSHGGFIDVYSELGKGTRFKIYLPAIETAQIKAEEKKKIDLPVGQGELILVVDDELSIREITKNTLESYNYQVITASDGADALACYAKNMEKVALVLIDMMMPYLDGPGTIRALQRMNANIKIIATSGLATNDKLAELTGVHAFLAKPYTAEKLLLLIAYVLSQHSD